MVFLQEAKKSWAKTRAVDSRRGAELLGDGYSRLSEVKERHGSEMMFMFLYSQTCKNWV